MGWNLVAVTTALAEDNLGQEVATVHTLTFVREDGRDCRTVTIGAAVADEPGGNWLPFLDVEELR